MTQAVEDGATRPVYYESRVVHLKLDQNTLALIDSTYDILEQQSDAVTIEKSKKMLGQMESVLGADSTIESLCDDIVEHYEKYRENLLTGKAMIVAYSRPIAMKIYRRILEIRPTWKEKVGVVMTSGNNDPEDWKEIIGTKSHKEELARKFKDILIRLVESKPIPDGTKSRLIDNYKFFSGKIADRDLQPAEIYESIGKLQIVNITLDRTMDDAQAIFESLNSTGKELSESDLIRNYVLMGLEPSEQTYVYEHLWRPMEQLFLYETQDSVMDSFFRHYLTMKLTRIPKQGRVYEEFKLYHLNCEFGTIRELCQDLLNYAKFYTDIVFKRSNNADLKRLYEDIVDLRMEVSYPFLLKVHNDCAKGTITEDNLKEILRLCISYVLRRSICDIPTNSMNKTFATLRNSIRPDDYMNSIKAFFVLQDTYKEFPDNEKFMAAFMSRDIYTMCARNYILSRLENFGNKAPIIIENYTIEHIMPQNTSLSPEWQHDLGVNWKEIQKIHLCV